LSRVWVAVSLMLLAAFAITADNISNQNAATAISAPATTASNAQE
jgi:biopolymer transport protein ExbD